VYINNHNWKTLSQPRTLLHHTVFSIPALISFLPIMLLFCYMHCTGAACFDVVRKDQGAQRNTIPLLYPLPLSVCRFMLKDLKVLLEIELFLLTSLQTYSRDTSVQPLCPYGCLEVQLSISRLLISRLHDINHLTVYNLLLFVEKGPAADYVHAP
jgi:hypothetical protein